MSEAIETQIEDTTTPFVCEEGAKIAEEVVETAPEEATEVVEHACLITINAIRELF